MSERKPIFLKPLGLKPRHIHEGERLAEISLAIERYVAALQTIPPEWIAEYNEIAGRWNLIPISEEEEREYEAAANRRAKNKEGNEEA